MIVRVLLHKAEHFAGIVGVEKRLSHIPEGIQHPSGSQDTVGLIKGCPGLSGQLIRGAHADKMCIRDRS